MIVVIGVVFFYVGGVFIFGEVIGIEFVGDVLCVLVVIVIGVGFFGVGVIFCVGEWVIGLMMVVGIWVVVVIGFFVVVGFFVLVVGGMVLVLLIVNILFWFYGCFFEMGYEVGKELE